MLYNHSSTASDYAPKRQYGGLSPVVSKTIFTLSLPTMVQVYTDGDNFPVRSRSQENIDEKSSF